MKSPTVNLTNWTKCGHSPTRSRTWAAKEVFKMTNARDVIGREVSRVFDDIGADIEQIIKSLIEIKDPMVETDYDIDHAIDDLMRLIRKVEWNG